MRHRRPRDEQRARAAQRAALDETLTDAPVALNNLVNSSTGVKEYNVHFAGAFIAALVLGMVQAIGAVYLPDAAVLLPFVFMIGILIWKPSGFAGSRT